MRNSFKKIITSFLSLCMVASFSACGTKDNSSENKAVEPVKEEQELSNLNVIAMKGPTGMGITKLMNDSENNNTKGKYTIQIVGTPEEVIAKLAKGETDIAALPANLAAVLYNKKGIDISAAAINTLGVLYIVENGDTIQSVADLKGKSMLATNKGSVPEFALNYILKQNNISPTDDIDIQFKSEATEVASILASGKINIAMLPQPFVTSALEKNKDLRVALNITDEWEKIDNSSQFLTGIIVVRNDVIKENKDEVINFLKEYKSSTEYINNNVKEGAKLVEKYSIAPATIAEKAIPQCNIVYIDGTDMKDMLSGYLDVLYKQNPKSVGGQLPDENFYFTAQN